jgi:hypothetical protein
MKARVSGFVLLATLASFADAAHNYRHMLRDTPPRGQHACPPGASASACASLNSWRPRGSVRTNARTTGDDFNVMDFGAKGDNATDNTAAFRKVAKLVGRS